MESSAQAKREGRHRGSRRSRARQFRSSIRNATRRDACVAAAVAAAGSLAGLPRTRGAASASLPHRAACATSTGTRRRPSSRRSPRRCCSSASTSATCRRRTRSASCAATPRQRARRRDLSRTATRGCGCVRGGQPALRGVVLAEHARRRGAGGDAALPHVICTNIEHPAVTACLRAPRAKGRELHAGARRRRWARRACRGRGRCHAGDGARDDHAPEQRGRLRAAAGATRAPRGGDGRGARAPP